MKEKNSYSRTIQSVYDWRTVSWGEKIKLFQHAVERDITSFLALGPGKEPLEDDSLGTALSESGLSRDEIQLIGGVHSSPISSKEIISQVEETISHLKTDYLDLLFVDSELAPDILMPSIERLYAQGKVVEIGLYAEAASNLQFGKGISARLRNWKFTAPNMLNLPKTTSGLTEMMWVHLEETEKFSKAVLDLSEKYEHSPQELLLAWFLQHPSHFHPVVASSSRDFMDAVMRAHHLKIIDEDWQKLPDYIHSN